MSKSTAILAAVLGATVLGGTVTVAALRRRTLELEARIERLEARQRDTVLRPDVARLEEKVERIEGDVAEARRAPVRSAPGPAGAPAPPFSDERLAQLIEEKVDEKVRARQGEDTGWGGKKRPLADVAKELQVTADVELRMAEIANQAKQQGFDAFAVPRSDGGNLADDLIAALLAGDQEKAGAQWMRMFKENVPGTQETYFAAAIRISDEAMKHMERVLTPEQFAKYKHTGVGPMDLETGFDPWAERMKK